MIQRRGGRAQSVRPPCTIYAEWMHHFSGGCAPQGAVSPHPWGGIFIYEDYALGEISKEKYKKMTSDYEAEQERLKLEIETTEEWVEQRQAMGDDLDTFIALTKKYVDVTELTQTIVNEYIKKIIIHAPDKSDGKRRQKVEIIFNFVDEVEIPVLAEPMIAESTLGRRKTA